MRKRFQNHWLALATVVSICGMVSEDVRASTLTWTGGASGNWDTTTPNWTGASTIWNNLTPDSAILGTASTLTLPTTLSGIVIDDLTTNAAVTLGASVASPASPEQMLTLHGGSGGVVTFGGTGTLTVESNLRVTGTPASGIVKTGTGRVFFKNQQNDFVGNFTINAAGADTNGGSFQLGGTFTTQPVPALPSDGAFGAASNSFIVNTNFTFFSNAGSTITLNSQRSLTINNSATLTVNGQANNSRAVGIDGSISGTGANLALTGASTRLVLGGANSFTGAVTIAGGGVTGTSPSQTLVPTILTVGKGASDSIATLGNGSNAVTINTATVSLNGVGGTISPGILRFSRSDYTFGGNIDGAGNVEANAAGVISLTGSNTYTGETLMQNGQIKVASSTNLPNASNIRFNGSGILILAGDFDLVSADDFTRALGTGANQVRFAGGGGFAAAGADRSINIGGSASTLTFGGTTNFLGAAQPLILSSSAATHKTIFKNPLDLGTTAGAREIRVPDGAAAIDAEITGVVSGTVGGLNKTNLGTLVLSNANTYSGATTVTAGTLTLATTGSIASATTVSNAATLRVDGTLTGTVTVNGNGDGTALNNGALQGTGFIAGNTVINGNLNPGNSVGKLTWTSGNLSLGDGVTAGATSNFEVVGAEGAANAGVTYDNVTLSSSGQTLSYDGTLNITFSSAPTAPGTYDLFRFTGTSLGGLDAINVTGAPGSLAGTFASSVWSGTINGLNAQFTLATGDLVLSLSAVPEPLTAAGVIMLATRILTRRSRASL